MDYIEALDTIDSRSSPQEVERAATINGHTLLYECIQIGKKRDLSWQETMQFAAIALASTYKKLLDKMIAEHQNKIAIDRLRLPELF